MHRFRRSRALIAAVCLGLTGTAVHAETPSDQVTRLIALAHKEDQRFIGGALLRSATACQGQPDATGCTIDQLIAHGAKHGFGLAADDAVKASHTAAPSLEFYAQAWPRALQLPANRPLLNQQLTAADQARVDKACPTHEIGCWGPYVLDFGMGIGIRLYQNAAQAHALDSLLASPAPAR